MIPYIFPKHLRLLKNTTFVPVDGVIVVFGERGTAAATAVQVVVRLILVVKGRRVVVRIVLPIGFQLRRRGVLGRRREIRRCRC